MDQTLVLITGPFRSGTSAVAQLVHRMGFCAAMTMTPPQPPRWHADWEDTEGFLGTLGVWPLGTPCTRDTRANFQFWFGGYLMRRMNHLRLLGEPWTKGICCKSPLYAPFLDAVGYEAEARGMAVKTIVCERDPEDSRVSIMESQPKFLWEPVLMAQEQIHAALAKPVPGALTVGFDALMCEPAVQVRRIADYLGVDEQDAARAIDARAVAGEV